MSIPGRASSIFLEIYYYECDFIYTDRYFEKPTSREREIYRAFRGNYSIL